MKKYFKCLAIFLCLIMAFGSVACGGSAETKESNTTISEITSETTEATVNETETKLTEIETTLTEIETTVTESETTVTEAETTLTETETTVTETETTVTETETTVTESETTVTESETTGTETETTITETEAESPELTITENGSGADAVTKDGFAYSVQNYISADGYKGFKINQSFEVTFPEGAFSKEFNRFKVDYRSTVPLKLFVTYTVDGEDRTDYYYLEAIKTSFRGLVETYLDGKNSTELKKIVISTCEEDEGDFILYGISLDTVEFYPDDLSVENDRFKVGVRLSWGGAMTYFEDKNDGIPDLGNLVNIHDTGRLIQQSFYGTYTNDEYVSGNYSDSKWPYNPVQGGTS